MVILQPQRCSDHGGGIQLIMATGTAVWGQYSHVTVSYNHMA